MCASLQSMLYLSRDLNPSLSTLRSSLHVWYPFLRLGDRSVRPWAIAAVVFVEEYLPVAPWRITSRASECRSAPRSSIFSLWNVQAEGCLGRSLMLTSACISGVSVSLRTMRQAPQRSGRGVSPPCPAWQRKAVTGASSEGEQAHQALFWSVLQAGMRANERSALPTQSAQPNAPTAATCGLTLSGRTRVPSRWAFTQSCGSVGRPLALQGAAGVGDVVSVLDRARATVPRPREAESQRAPRCAPPVPPPARCHRPEGGGTEGLLRPVEARQAGTAGPGGRLG
jgi:hypothetical protein